MDTISYDTNVNISYDYLVWENTENYFLSYTLDISNWYILPSMDLLNSNFQYLASQLTPAILRVGGGKADYTYYFDLQNGSCSNLPNPNNFDAKTYHCFTKTNLTNLINFVDNVGCKLVFGLSIGYPYYPDNNTISWNSTNTETFLNYIINNNLSKYFYGFELGNENNKVIQPSFQANAFKKLYNIINNIWPNNTNKPILIGPDSGNKLNSANNTMYQWIINFVQDTCSFIDGYTYHSYINQNSTQILTLNAMNMQHNWSLRFSETIWNYCGNGTNYGNYKLIFAGEIAETYHGGVDGLTNVYQDCLWYLDALGTLMKVGQNGFFRQQLYGNAYHPDYALLDGTNKDNPYSTLNPDYWIAYLFNILIGNKVLNATSSNNYFRVYSNCYINNNGSIILYYINLSNEKANLTFDKNKLGTNHVDYILTTKQSQLNTTNIVLNGNLLQLDDKRKIPTIDGIYSNSNEMKIDAYSVGFIHFVDVEAQACRRTAS